MTPVLCKKTHCARGTAWYTGAMQDILRAIFSIVIWTFVPTILIVAIVKAYRIGDKIDNKLYKSAARSGFLGGFVLFLIFLIHQLGLFVQNGFPDAAIYQGFNVWLAVFAMFATYVIFYSGRVLPARLVGWIVLIISFASWWTLFHYLFIHTANEYILSTVLGIAFGIFSHTAFSPVTIDDLLNFL
jgi:hypothetical protein